MLWALVGVVLLLRDDGGDGGGGTGVPEVAPRAEADADGSGARADGPEAVGLAATDPEGAAPGQGRPHLVPAPAQEEGAGAFWARCVANWALGGNVTPLVEEAQARLAAHPGEIFEAVHACRGGPRGGTSTPARVVRSWGLLDAALAPAVIASRVREELVARRQELAAALVSDGAGEAWSAVFFRLRPHPSELTEVFVGLLAAMTPVEEPAPPPAGTAGRDAMMAAWLRLRRQGAAGAPAWTWGAAVEVVDGADPAEAASRLEAWLRSPAAAGPADGPFPLPVGMELVLQQLAAPGLTPPRIAAWRPTVVGWFAAFPDRLALSPWVADVAVRYGIPPEQVLARLLADGDPRGGAQALRLLQAVGADEFESLRGLADLVATSGPASVALAFARRLVAAGGAPRELLVALALRALTDPLYGREAIKLLPHVTESVEEVRPAIERLLASDATGLAPVAGEAIAALTTLPAREHADLVRFIESVALHREPEVRVAVLTSLPQSLHLPGDLPVATRLVDAGLADRDARVSRAAAEALGWMAQRHPDLRPVLARHATHPDPGTAELLAAWAEELAEHDAEVAEESAPAPR